MSSLTKTIEQLAFPKSPASIVIKAARYGISTGGRHLRAQTALATYESLGKNPELFMRCAAGLECIHQASVILDDLPMMDNAPIRRGKPAVHVAFSPSIAILAALYLETRGRELIRTCAEEHNLPAATLHQVIASVESTAQNLILGQGLDLKSSRTRKELERMLEDKNALFLLACQLPVLFLKKKNLLDRFSRVGSALSVGYQLVDDLRDLRPESVTGKPVGVDAAKRTSLYIYGEQALQARIEKIRSAIHAELELLPKSARLRTLVDQIFDLA